MADFSLLSPNSLTGTHSKALLVSGTAAAQANQGQSNEQASSQQPVPNSTPVTHRAVEVSREEGLEAMFRKRVDACWHSVEQRDAEKLLEALQITTNSINAIKCNFLFPEEIDLVQTASKILLDQDKYCELERIAHSGEVKHSIACKAFKVKLVEFLKDAIAGEQYNLLKNTWQEAYNGNDAREYLLNHFTSALGMDKRHPAYPAITTLRINGFIVLRNDPSKNKLFKLEEGTCVDFKIYSEIVRQLRDEIAKSIEDFALNLSSLIKEHGFRVFFDLEGCESLTYKHDYVFKEEDGNGCTPSEIAYLTQLSELTMRFRSKLLPALAELKIDKKHRITMHVKEILQKKDKDTAFVDIIALFAKLREFFPFNVKVGDLKDKLAEKQYTKDIDVNTDSPWSGVVKAICSLIDELESKDLGESNNDMLYLFKAKFYYDIAFLCFPFQLAFDLHPNDNLDTSEAGQRVEAFFLKKGINSLCQQVDYRIRLITERLYPYYREFKPGVLEDLGLELNSITKVQTGLVIASEDLRTKNSSSKDLSDTFYNLATGLTLKNKTSLEERFQELRPVFRKNIQILRSVDTTRFSKRMTPFIMIEWIEQLLKNNCSEEAGEVAEFLVSLVNDDLDLYFLHLSCEISTYSKNDLSESFKKSIKNNLLEIRDLYVKCFEILDRKKEGADFKQRFDEMLNPSMADLQKKLEQKALTKAERIKVALELLAKQQAEQKRRREAYQAWQAAQKAKQHQEGLKATQEARAKLKEAKKARRAEKAANKCPTSIAMTSTVVSYAGGDKKKENQIDQEEDFVDNSAEAIQERKRRKAILKQAREKRESTVHETSEATPNVKEKPLYYVMDNKDALETFQLLTSDAWKTVSYSQKEMLNLIKSLGGYRNQGNGGSHLTFTIPSFDRLTGASSGCEKESGLCVLVSYQKKVPEYQLRQMRVLLNQLGFMPERVVAVLPEGEDVDEDTDSVSDSEDSDSKG